jgi:hypothetical protein
MKTLSLPATNAKRLRKGAAATKQSIFYLAARWIASLTLAMTIQKTFSWLFEIRI